MASPVRTSSSSLPCRTNPNMKKSELCDPMRRSFSGNPFTKPSVITNPRAFDPNTPANSPSDFPRRHSTGRESVSSLRDSNKENSKDKSPKPTRVPKGTKNFMSPTISAASKINASPRKKILAERNEPARSSVSLSDVKSLIMEENEPTQETALKQKKVSFSDAIKGVTVTDESTPEIGLKQKKVSFSNVQSIIMEDKEPTPEISLKQKVSFADDESTPQIGLKQKNIEVPHHSPRINHEHEELPLKCNADFDSNAFLETVTVTEEKDSVNVDPSFKISPRVSISPSCPVVAPLDADPLMIPYDPQINYLSPRPQFLRYRPNPRIELYREREGKQLEEHFASESHSDSDVTEETQSEISHTESDDISSEEAMKEGEEEEELEVSEPNPISSDMVEEKFEAKRMSKPRFSTRSKFIALILVLAFAYFSVLAANSPALTGLEQLGLSNFQVPPQVKEFTKATFDRFTQNLQHWSDSFLSCVSNIISRSREVHKLGPFQYANLSHLLEDHMIEGHLTLDDTAMEPVRERDAVTEPFEAVVDEGEDEEQEDQENEAYGNQELVSEEEPDEVQEGIEAEMVELDQLETEESKGVESTAQIDSTQSNLDLEDQPNIVPQDTEIQHDTSKTGVPEGDDLNNIDETVFPKEVKSDDNSQSSEVVDSTTTGPVDRFLSENVMGVSLLFFCLLAASAFIYTKRGKPSMTNAAVPVEPPVLAKKKSEYYPVSVSSKGAEVDMSDESCPSEMSSCRRTSSSSYDKNGLKESNEYQSQERKPRKTYRRESLASSDYSMGSLSYGSFTTYEKKHNKHGGEEEEIVTPVRRSSRIRNLTSP